MDQPRQDTPATGLRQRVGPLWPFGVVIGVIIGIWGVHRWWVGEPYPAEDPTRTMERLHGYSQTAYDMVGLQEEVAPRAETTPCVPTGFSGSLSAQSSTDAFGISYEWYVSVDPSAGRPALDRLREGLEAEGWQVSVEEFSDPDRLELRMEHKEDGLVARFNRESWREGSPMLEFDFSSPCREFPDDFETLGGLRSRLPPLSPTTGTY
ncbi:hypothetical protein [Streptomyces hainanensis]|uniref:Uncharacterized protein n=1 Tax=Streptomyces hainanensis TaxID=402648 RepID=A0A4R4TP25_9ACTN|nr:hypothetical protein [Streptomyces hainanensis]TDC77664.1 hypothetical protein E1283_06865 [Streptomyces hainanensis]